jgi:hypothetical protein
MIIEDMIRGFGRRCDNFWQAAPKKTGASQSFPCLRNLHRLAEPLQVCTLTNRVHISIEVSCIHIPIVSSRLNFYVTAC